MHRSLTPRACCNKCPWHDQGRSWSRTHPRWGKRFRRFRSCPYYRGCERQCERQCDTRSIVHGRLNRLVLHSGDNKKEGIYPSHSCKLYKCITVDEIMDDFVVTNEPLIVLLKDSISERTTELVDDSVESRFGGRRLPTSIKYSDKIITHFRNQVTMKTNFRHTIGRGNRRVCLAPVGVACDGGVHLGFDLTHVWCRLFDLLIQYRNGRRLQPLPCHLVNRHTATLDFTYVMGNNHRCSIVINQCTLIYILCAMFGHYVTLTC